MHIFTTNTPKFYKRTPDSLVITAVTLPAGAFQVAPVQNPSFTIYNKRTFIAGQFDPMLVWTEYGDLEVTDIAVPTTAAVAIIGASTGITATSIRYYFTFADKQDDVIVNESALSSSSNIIPAVSNKSINISSLPTTHVNTRVNKIRLYRSDNGGSKRHVADIALGTSTYVDTIPTLSLGATAPTNNGAPPYCKYNETYHDRVWYAGDPENPQRIYYSELRRGESVGPLNFIDARDGEKVTGIKRVGDLLLVGCRSCFYAISGYSESNFVMRKISPDIGLASHHSMVNIDETLWFASPKGVYMYNGSFIYMMKDLQNYWRDAYFADTTSYQSSIAIDSKYHEGYLLLIPGDSAFYYFGYYPPTKMGQQPDWFWDVRDREDTALGLLASDGAFIFDAHVGSSDGYVRLMDDYEDNDDDGDTYNKLLTIQTGAQLFGDPGGSKEEGKSFNEIWTYVDSELSAWILYCLAGDEDCVNSRLPDNTDYFWKDSVAASAVSGKTALSTHYHQPIKVSGRALSLKITCSAPLDFSFRGYGLIYGDGGAGRPVRV